MPQVVYLGEETVEAELVEAFKGGQIDAIARGEVGNRDASLASNGELVVAALDEAAELGGFALGTDDVELAACLEEKINYLTDNQRIGYGDCALIQRFFYSAPSNGSPKRRSIRGHIFMRRFQPLITSEVLAAKQQSLSALQFGRVHAEVFSDLQLHSVNLGEKSRH